MSDEPLKLGGMALRNGLLVHGPTSWAAAVRSPDGTLHAASGRKPELPHPQSRRYCEVMAERGLTAPTWPKEYGGGGLDKEQGKIFLTELACKLLDLRSCRCRDYGARHASVPDCVVIGMDNLRQIPWLPESCAYRRLAEGRGLEWWHPLVSGDPQTVHYAGISVRGWFSVICVGCAVSTGFSFVRWMTVSTVSTSTCSRTAITNQGTPVFASTVW